MKLIIALLGGVLVFDLLESVQGLDRAKKKKSLENCAEETKINVSELLDPLLTTRKIRELYENHYRFRCFSRCYFLSIGLMSEDSTEFNTELYEEVFGIENKNLDDIGTECAIKFENISDACDRSYKIGKCIYKKARM